MHAAACDDAGSDPLRHPRVGTGVARTQHASARGVTAIEHVVVLMEKAIAAMKAVGTTASQVVIVFHFEGFGFFDCDPRLATAFVSLIGQQYPERLHRLILIDAPFLFEPIWSLVWHIPHASSPTGPVRARR